MNSNRWFFVVNVCYSFILIMFFIVFHQYETENLVLPTYWLLIGFFLSIIFTQLYNELRQILNTNQFWESLFVFCFGAGFEAMETASILALCLLDECFHWKHHPLRVISDIHFFIFNFSVLVYGFKKFVWSTIRDWMKDWIKQCVQAVEALLWKEKNFLWHRFITIFCWILIVVFILLQSLLLPNVVYDKFVMSVFYASFTIMLILVIIQTSLDMVYNLKTCKSVVAILIAILITVQIICGIKIVYDSCYFHKCLEVTNNFIYMMVIVVGFFLIVISCFGSVYIYSKNSTDNNFNNPNNRRVHPLPQQHQVDPPIPTIYLLPPPFAPQVSNQTETDFPPPFAPQATNQTETSTGVNQTLMRPNPVVPFEILPH